MVNLHSDQPIQTFKEDVLGRKILAQNIGKAIAGWKGAQSLVLALNGPWGSGKSSVKNLVLEHLRSIKRAPIIVEFNPWEISGQHALTEEFFRTIAESIPEQSQQSQAAAAKECSARLTGWGDRLARLGKGGRFAAQLLRKASPITGDYAPIVEGVAVALEAAAGAAERSAEVAKAGAEAAQPEPADSQSLPEQKAELATALKALSRPILVVVDDIDRLASDEICLLFRLVKANCDFPGFAFLLLFDRPYVCSALDQVTNKHGEEFLEKIVQVSLTIGAPDRDIIRSYLRKEVLAVIPKCALREPIWDEARWNSLVDHFVAPNIRHLRDLRRLVNAFALSLGGFTAPRTCEVNPIVEPIAARGGAFGSFGFCEW